MRTSMLTALLFTLPVVAAEPAKKDAAPAETKAPAKAAKKVELAVTDDGFVPANVPLKKGEAVRFSVTRKTDATCAKDLLIEGTDIKLALPLNKTVEVDYTPAKSGKIKFGCAMGMMIGGVLVVD